MTEPVDIEFRINDQELERASQRAVDSIMGINSAGEQTVKTLRSQISEQKQLIKEIEKDVGEVAKKYNDELRNQISEQKQLIKGLEKDVKDVTRAYDNMVPSRAKDEYASTVRYTSQALNEEIGELKKLEARLDATQDASKRFTTSNHELAEQLMRIKPAGQQNIEQFRQFSTEINSVMQALDKEKNTLKGLESQLDTVAEASKRLTSTKRALNDQMSRLKLAGRQDTEEFRKLAEGTSVVEKAIQEVNKQTVLLGKTDSNFQGLVNGVSGLTGALSAGAGAMALFGTESKDLQQVQTRLQALMALTIGLQQTYNTINKESAFQTVIVTKAKKLWTAAQVALNTQLGISTALSKALMVSGIGLIIAGVYAAIKAYQEWNKEQKALSGALNEARKNIQAEVTNLKSLEAVLKDSNNTYNSRKAALDKIKEVMPGYNAMLDKEGRLIEDNTGALEKYIEQLKNAAVAKVYADRAAEA